MDKIGCENRIKWEGAAPTLPSVMALGGGG